MIKVYKLQNGIEFIANRASERRHLLINPMQIVRLSSDDGLLGGVELVDWLVYSQDTTIDFDDSQIMYSYIPAEVLERMYTNAVEALDEIREEERKYLEAAIDAIADEHREFLTESLNKKKLN